MVNQTQLTPDVIAVKEDHSDIVKRNNPECIHSYDLLSVYTKGGPRYQLNNTLYHFKPSGAMLLNKGAIDLDLQEGKVNGVFILFNGNGIIKKQPGSDTELIVSLGTDTITVPVFKEISAAYADKIANLIKEIGNIPGAGLINRMQKTSLLYQAIALYCDSFNSDYKNTPHREAFLLHEFINERALEGLTMKEIYHSTNLSSAYVETLFKKAYGISPVAYRMQIRLSHARKLLATTRNNVSQVAYSVGFSDPLYFSRVFLKAFGINPSRIIKESAYSRNKGEKM